MSAREKQNIKNSGCQAMQFGLHSEIDFLILGDSDYPKKKWPAEKGKTKDMKAQLVGKEHLTRSPLATFFSLPSHLSIPVYKLRMKNGMFKITYTQKHI